MLSRHEIRTLMVPLPIATVMRRGSEPKIQMFASIEEIGIKMDLPHFVKTTAARARKRYWWLRLLPLEYAMLSAASDVIDAMKRETPKILSR